MPPRILIAGIGNIFLGDDAFGVEAVAEVVRRKLPDGVQVCDFGIRGLDLAYALTDGYDAVILVDAVPRGGTPGQLYVIEPEFGDLDEPDEVVAIDTHEMNPVRVLRMVRALGGKLEKILVVGCEPSPAPDGYEEMQPGLSDTVRDAIPRAADLIVQVAEKLASGSPLQTPLAADEQNLERTSTP